MVDYDTNVRISEIVKSINEVKESMDKLLQVVKPEEDLWDNSQVIRNWKVSERTLASWRKERLISFVQLKDKIWYTKEARGEFLQKNLININKDGRN